MRSKSISQEVWGFRACWCTCGAGFTTFLFFYSGSYTGSIYFEMVATAAATLNDSKHHTVHIFLLRHDFSPLPGSASSITRGTLWALWCYLWFTVLHWKNMGGPREITFASRDMHFPGQMSLSRAEDECYMDIGNAELTTIAAGGGPEAITVVDDVPQLILCSLL